MSEIKLLIVEDEVITVFLLQQLLKDKYTIIDIVPYGDRAIEAVQEHRPDVILMDIGLKGSVNGIEAMKEIRKHVDTPVIYTSYLSHGPTIQRALEVKNARFMPKPVQQQELEKNIQELLSGSACPL